MRRARTVAAVAAALAAGLLAPADSQGRGAKWYEVLAIQPTNGQEVSADLGETDGAVEIGLWYPLRARARRALRRLPETGAGSPFSLLHHDFARVPAAVEYDRRLRMIRLVPPGPLEPGQYTIQLGSPGDLHGRRRAARIGEPSFARVSAFTVGPDRWGPRLLEATPAANQSDVDPFAPVSLRFNESLDPYSVILGRSVTVDAEGDSGLLPVAGALRLVADGFAIEFHPEPATGLPAGARVRVRLLGGEHPDAVRDRLGNAMSLGDGAGDVFELPFDTRPAR